ncbi:MAG: hypothetical protein LBE20_01370 [Deltaproteobacteria bacterium]|jgi:hypothetical protein|nr:hypothetical protein [Deltaproteobacteria bacterium]
METVINSKKCSQNTSLLPIDFGFNFAWANRRIFLILGIILTVINAVIYQLIFNLKQFSLEQSFIFLSVLNLFLVAAVWTFSAVLAIEKGQQKIPQLKNLLLSSISFLPKTLISLGLILVLMAFGMVFMPLILIFFIWSPFFGIADFYSKETKPIFPDDEDDFLLIPEDKEETFFSNSVLNFGLLRSSSLSNQNFATTAYLILIILFVLSLNFIILSCFQMVTDNRLVNYGINIFGSVSQAFLAGIVAGSFLAVLPEKARNELQIKNLSTVLQSQRLFKIQSNRTWTLIVLFGLLLNFSGVYYFLIVSKDLPSSAQVQITAAYQDASDLVLKLKITDQQKHLTWLVPTSFVIQYPELGKNPEFVLPSSFSMSDLEQKTLKTLTPDVTQIILTLRFVFQKPAESKVNFDVYYYNVFDIKQEKILVVKGALEE